MQPHCHNTCTQMVLNAHTPHLIMIDHTTESVQHISKHSDLVCLIERRTRCIFGPGHYQIDLNFYSQDRNAWTVIGNPFFSMLSSSNRWFVTLLLEPS